VLFPIYIINKKLTTFKNFKTLQVIPDTHLQRWSRKDVANGNKNTSTR